MNKFIYTVVTAFFASCANMVTAQPNVVSETIPLSAPVVVNFTQLAAYEIAHPPKLKQHTIEQGEDREEKIKPTPRAVQPAAPVFNIDLYKPEKNQRIAAASPTPSKS